MTMSARRLIERFVDEVLNGTSVEALDALFHPSYLDHEPLSGRSSGGVDDLRLLVSFLALATTDIRFTLEDVFESEQRAAYRIFGEGPGSVDEFSKLVAHRQMPDARFDALRRSPTQMGLPLRSLPTGILHYSYSSTGIFIERGGKFQERWGRAFLFATPVNPPPHNS